MSAYNINTFLIAHKETNIFNHGTGAGAQFISYSDAFDLVEGDDGSAGAWNKFGVGTGSRGGYQNDGTGPHIGPTNGLSAFAWVYENGVSGNPGSGWQLTEL